MQFLSYLGARLREPSSYAGLIGLALAFFHVTQAQDLKTAIVSILVGIGGVIAILLPEGKAGKVAAILIFGFVVFSVAPAHAQNVAAATAAPAVPAATVIPASLPYVTKSPAVSFFAPAACSNTSCPSFFVGGSLVGLAGSANLLGGGLNNSIFQGGGMVGLSAGYRYWNGAWYMGAELSGLYQSQNGSNVVGFAPGGMVGIAGIKLGGNAASFFNQGASTSTQGPIAIPTQLASSLMAPYIEFADVIRANGSEFATGAGAEFTVGGGWTFDVAYLYAPPVNNLAALNLVKFGFDYNFK